MYDFLIGYFYGNIAGALIVVLLLLKTQRSCRR